MSLRDYRLRAGLTQVQLAERSGVEQSHIAKIETGTVRMPTWPTIHALATALNVEPEVLFPPVPVPEPSEAAAS